MKQIHANALQAAFVALLAAAIVAMASTAKENLLRQNISPGFSFLFDRTGWDVGASFLAQSAADPYWWTFLVGLGNTLILSFVCIVLATALGFVLALAGAGRSRIPYTASRLYVAGFRNIPIIVQLFFWYHVTRALPPVRQAIELFGCCYASNRGIYAPHVTLSAEPTQLVVGLLAVLGAVVALRWWDRNRVTVANPPLRPWVRPLVFIAMLVLAGSLILRIDVTLPRLQGFNFVDGMYLSPEFAALVMALVTYNIAFVCEIVNSGIRSVPQSQIEAARIIGLSDQRIFWRITLPQAIRVAIPPLINQYISIAKSSSLAIAIGYTDLFSVGVVAINHTGQSINVVALLMLVYLVISLVLSGLGNLYNASVRMRGSG